MKRGVYTHAHIYNITCVDYFSFLVASIRFLLSRTHSNLSNDFFQFNRPLNVLHQIYLSSLAPVEHASSTMRAGVGCRSKRAGVAKSEA